MCGVATAHDLPGMATLGTALKPMPQGSRGIEVNAEESLISSIRHAPVLGHDIEYFNAIPRSLIRNRAGIEKVAQCHAAERRSRPEF